MTRFEMHAQLRRYYDREARLTTDLECVADDIALLNQTMDEDVSSPPSDLDAVLKARMSLRRAATEIAQLRTRDESLRLLWIRLDTECVSMTQRVADAMPELPFCDLVRRG